MKINASLIVLLATAVFPATLVTTYGLALYNHHVIAFWPYISHTGNHPVESCFFSFGLNVVAGLYILIVHLRYVQIRFLLPQESKLNVWNKSGEVIGILSSVALSTTCNFQQRHVLVIHVVSAIVCSYSALAYFWHQTVFSHICPRPASPGLRALRTVLSSASTAVHMAGPCLFAYSIIEHRSSTGNVTGWVGRDLEGTNIYLVGSFFEWTVFLCNTLYIASFFSEFKNISFEIDRILVM